MRRFVISIVTIFLVLFLFSMPVMAKKAGEVEDNIFTDSEYGFSLEVPQGWAYKIYSAKKPERIAMDQKSYPVPQAYQGGNEDYAQIPMIIVLADTTSLGVDQFVAKMLDSEFDSKQKKYFMRRLRLISGQYEELKRKEVSIQDVKSIQLYARQQYTTEVPQRGSDKADVYTDFKAGVVFFYVRDGHVFIIHMIYEYQFNAQYSDLFDSKLIPSLKFAEKE